MNRDGVVWKYPQDGRDRQLKPMGFKPHGLDIMQSWEQVGLYLLTIDRYAIDLFVEIGVARAGLQQFIVPRTRFVDGFRYIGCEANAELLPEQLWQRNVYTCVGNCFSDSFWAILDTAIKESRVTFILCDGGNKPKELAYFSKMLRMNDYICAHDFGDEVKEEDLDCLRSEWVEVEPELYRAALIPLFRKVTA